jgi:hypothetical protein
MKEIESNFDFNNPNYKSFFQTIEKIVLKKLSTVEDKKREQLIGQEDIKRVEETDKQKVGELQKRLEKKKQDEWGKIINYDYEQYLEETKNNLIEEKNKKMKIFNELQNQIKHKMKQNEKLKECEENYYNEIFKKALDELEIQEKEKHFHTKEQFLKEKELLLSSIKEQLYKKKDTLDREKEIDRKLLEECAKEEAYKKIEAEVKKKDIMQQQMKVKAENDKKMMEKEEEKQKARIMDKKIQDEYAKILERQEMANKQILKKSIKQQKNIPKEYFENVESRKQEEYEMEIRYLKELEKIEKK